MDELELIANLSGALARAEREKLALETELKSANDELQRFYDNPSRSIFVSEHYQRIAMVEAMKELKEERTALRIENDNLKTAIVKAEKALRNF